MPAEHVATAIDLMIAGFQDLKRRKDEITLPEFRRMKLLRFELADFIVEVVKPPGIQPKPERET